MAVMTRITCLIHSTPVCHGGTLCSQHYLQQVGFCSNCLLIELSYLKNNIIASVVQPAQPTGTKIMHGKDVQGRDVPVVSPPLDSVAKAPDLPTIHEPSMPASYTYAVASQKATESLKSDSSIETTRVPSVFIRIRDALSQGRGALTQGIATVSAAAGDLAARMPRQPSRSAMSVEASTTESVASAPSSPHIARAPPQVAQPDELSPAVEVERKPVVSPEQKCNPVATKKRSSKKAVAEQAPAAEEKQPAADAVFFELSLGEEVEASASGTALPHVSSPSPEIELLGDASPVGGGKRQDVAPCGSGISAVDDLDDFFRHGNVSEANDNATTPTDDVFGFSNGQTASNSTSAETHTDLIAGMRAVPADVGPREAGDVFLERITEEARTAISSLPPDRGTKVQQAIATSFDYVNTRVVCCLTLAILKNG
jgi:hypothetical protein